MTTKIIEIIEKLNSSSHHFLPAAKLRRMAGVFTCSSSYRVPTHGADVCPGLQKCATPILRLLHWPRVTADWRLGAAVLSSLISQAKLLRCTETGGAVPGDTHPAIPLSQPAPSCPTFLLSACGPLTCCNPHQMLVAVSFSDLSFRSLEVVSEKQLYWANTEKSLANTLCSFRCLSLIRGSSWKKRWIEQFVDLKIVMTVHLKTSLVEPVLPQKKATVYSRKLNLDEICFAAWI